MCGRYSLHCAVERLMEQFGVVADPALRPRFNIAPSQLVPAVRAGAAGRELAMLRWGLIPFWAKDAKIGYKMINARAETVASKPAYRSAYRRRRCLIAADGFYEWKPDDAGGKQPYHIRLRDGDVFAFAGLWERWEGGKNGPPIESCTIIVTAANDQLRPIHDRMPVIVRPGDYEIWLDTSQSDASRLEEILQPYPGEAMVAYPVSTHVNRPANDDAQCIESVPS